MAKKQLALNISADHCFIHICACHRTYHGLQENRQDYTPLLINREQVETVATFKFLHTHISADHSWTFNIRAVVKKAQQWPSAQPGKNLQILLPQKSQGHHRRPRTPCLPPVWSVALWETLQVKKNPTPAGWRTAFSPGPSKLPTPTDTYTHTHTRAVSHNTPHPIPPWRTNNQPAAPHLSARLHSCKELQSLKYFNFFLRFMFIHKYMYTYICFSTCRSVHIWNFSLYLFLWYAVLHCLWSTVALWEHPKLTYNDNKGYPILFIPYWHFDKTCHIMFTSHSYDLTFMSWVDGMVVELRGRKKSARKVTTVWDRQSSFWLEDVSSLGLSRYFKLEPDLFLTLTKGCLCLNLTRNLSSNTEALGWCLVWSTNPEHQWPMTWETHAWVSHKLGMRLTNPLSYKLEL